MGYGSCRKGGIKVDLFCDKCNMILLEDCETYATINNKVNFIGFKCTNCGWIWIAKKEYEKIWKELEE